jgi:hypothetical protein
MATTTQSGDRGPISAEPTRDTRPGPVARRGSPVDHYNYEITSSFVHRCVLPSAFDVTNPAELRSDVSPQELQFVRRVSELLPILSQEQVEALRERINSGYYDNVEVTRVIAERLASLFGTD